MRVRLLARMIPRGYSGGRLLSLLLGESLATVGAYVDFLVDNIPEMYDEFRSFSRMRLISANILNLSPWVDESVDVVVIVPGTSDIKMHGEFLRHALECRSKIVMINFESENWFNSVSPVKREEKHWLGWNIISEYCDMILSISGEGNKYAKDYYKKAPSKCIFDFSYPAINSVLADQAEAPVERMKEIVFLTRIAPYKGFDDLIALRHTDLSGYGVSVFVGFGKTDKEQIESLKSGFQEVGMRFHARPVIKGVDKFRLLKSSAVKYFPTRFEGFGMPPLEAAYCRLPVACSDLPVLREFGRNAFHYADPTDPVAMRSAVLAALEAGPEPIDREMDHFRRIARIEEYGKRVLASFERLF